MNVRLTQLRSSYDCNGKQQYRIEVKSGFFGFWKDFDNIYAPDLNTAVEKAKTLLKGCRLDDQIVETFNL